MCMEVNHTIKPCSAILVHLVCVNILLNVNISSEFLRLEGKQFLGLLTRVNVWVKGYVLLLVKVECLTCIFAMVCCYVCNLECL